MKPIKVFFNGKRLRDIYPHATKWQVFKWRVRRFTRKLVIISLVLLCSIGVFKLGGLLDPQTIVTKAEVIKQVEIKAPIMDRIADCESGARDKHGKPIKGSATHLDKNGQVLMRSNTNRSVDLGKYQINSVWFIDATRLGYNLTIEADNEAMALWIYKNKGTQPWYASESCWK